MSTWKMESMISNHSIPEPNMKFDPKEYQANLQKYSTESIIKERKANQDRILNILDPRRQKFSTISEKIKDMQQRAGVAKLSELKREELSKKGQAVSTNNIKLFVKFPELKEKIVEFIKTNPHTDVPAILNKLGKAAQVMIDNRGMKDINISDFIEDPALVQFVEAYRKNEQNSQNLVQDQNISIQYPEMDDQDRTANDDVLSALQPNKTN